MNAPKVMNLNKAYKEIERITGQRPSKNVAELFALLIAILDDVKQRGQYVRKQGLKPHSLAQFQALACSMWPGSVEIQETLAGLLQEAYMTGYGDIETTYRN